MNDWAQCLQAQAHKNVYIHHPHSHWQSIWLVQFATIPLQPYCKHSACVLADGIIHITIHAQIQRNANDSLRLCNVCVVRTFICMHVCVYRNTVVVIWQNSAFSIDIKIISTLQSRRLFCYQFLLNILPTQNQTKRFITLKMCP